MMYQLWVSRSGTSVQKLRSCEGEGEDGEV